VSDLKSLRSLSWGRRKTYCGSAITNPHFFPLIIFTTAPNPESEVPLLEDPSDSEDDLHLPGTSSNTKRKGKEKEKRKSRMDSKELGTLASVEAQGAQEDYDTKGKDGLDDTLHTSARGSEVNSQDSMAPAALEHAVEVLETRNTRWYAYFLTREFWIVLLLGFAYPLPWLAKYRAKSECTAKSFPYALLQRILSQLCWIIKELLSLLSRLFSTMCFLLLYIPHIPFSNMDPGNISSC
jgi:hypothetical protein